MPIFFTPEQANDYLPEVRRVVHRVLAINKDTYDSTSHGTSKMRQLEREVQKLEELGCLLKDVNTGLVGFPAVGLGRRVWSCWMPGEDRVSFWHKLEEGYAGRKMILKDEFYDDDAAIRSLAEVAKSEP